MKRRVMSERPGIRIVKHRLPHSNLGRLVWLVMMVCAGCDNGSTVGWEQWFGNGATIVDLTHSVSVTGPFWPSARGNPFRHDTLVSHPDGAPSMAASTIPEHFGTHLDAPVHSAAGQRPVDELTARELFGPAVVIDVVAQSLADPDYLLTTQDVLSWEAQHGVLPEHAVVLMRTGWSEKWNDPVAYRNMDSTGQMHFPGFSAEVARFLVEERQINGIGIDNFSVDAAVADGFPVHGIVNGNGKYHLENVANLDRIPEFGAYLLVAPIKIRGGSGGQVRLFALLPSDAG